MWRLTNDQSMTNHNPCATVWSEVAAMRTPAANSTLRSRFVSDWLLAACLVARGAWRVARGAWRAPRASRRAERPSDLGKAANRVRLAQVSRPNHVGDGEGDKPRSVVAVCPLDLVTATTLVPPLGGRRQVCHRLVGEGRFGEAGRPGLHWDPRCVDHVGQGAVPTGGDDEPRACWSVWRWAFRPRARQTPCWCRGARRRAG